MIYHRTIQSEIEKNLFRGKVVIVYGARRTGKTTLCQLLLEKYPENSKYINCELLQNQQALSSTNSELLKAFLGSARFVVLDEAQEIPWIGKILKVLADTFPQLQILATGSSSFDLAQTVSEPLTGRTRQYTLYPLSLEEVVAVHDVVFAQARLETMLRFGLYPSVPRDAQRDCSKQEVFVSQLERLPHLYCSLTSSTVE